MNNININEWYQWCAISIMMTNDINHNDKWLMSMIKDDVNENKWYQQKW